MDPSDRPQHTPGSNMKDVDNHGNFENDLTNWPFPPPSREALGFLEQSLTTEVPRPSYDEPIRRFVVLDGAHAHDNTFTMPIGTPSRIAESIPPEDMTWIHADWSLPLDLEASDDDQTRAAAGADRDDQGGMSGSNDASPVATGGQSPRRGRVSRPKPSRALRPGITSRAQSRSTARKKKTNVASNIPRRPNPSGLRHAINCDTPQGEAGAASSETTPSPPRLMVTIKSHTGTRKWQEFEQED